MALVFQDMVGGLEVHDRKQFLPVVPKPGTVVNNVGDILDCFPYLLGLQNALL